VIGSQGLRLLSQFPFATSPADHVYLVDSQGFLMMRFPRDPDPSRMIRDLQRLLKYAR
jgi:hypothetical protein